MLIPKYTWAIPRLIIALKQPPNISAQLATVKIRKDMLYNVAASIQQAM